MPIGHKGVAGDTEEPVQLRSQQLMPRLLIINQVAGPLMVELLSDLRDRGVACKILTGQIEAPTAQQTGIDVLPAAPLRRQGAVRRMWSWGLFTLQALWTMLRLRRWPMLVVTNPPLVMLAMPLFKRLFGVRYSLLVYDIYPDVMERMGMLRPGGFWARLWKRRSGRSMHSAAAVITIGRQMAQVLRSHLRSDDDCRIDVIPTWVDTDFIRPIDMRQNPFVGEHGLEDKFVVLYSGSFGATHDIESIVDAAGLLVDVPDVQIVLIGGGTRWKELQALVAARNLPNLKMLPFQPRDVLPYSLAAADCQIVTLDEAFAGISVPSKTYYALAAGSALLAVSPPGTELVDLVEEHGCGLHVLPRDAAALAEAIRRLRREGDLRATMRSQSRQTAVQYYSRTVAIKEFVRVLENGFAWPRGSGHAC